jgi:predicted nucleic acid-binding protein
MLCSRNAWKDGEILGRLGDRAASGRRADDAPLQALAGQDPDMLVLWGSQVECVSALARLERAAALDVRAASIALERLTQLVDERHEVEPGDVIRENAMRFLRVHLLRAADALQLAAAFVAAEHRPSSLQIVTLDERLADAARKEGFALVDIAAG